MITARNPKVAQALTPKLDWWRQFRSRELTAVIEQAHASNLDLAAAVARIVQADAQARITGAALLPAIDFNGNTTRARDSQTLEKGNTNPNTLYPPSNSTRFNAAIAGRAPSNQVKSSVQGTLSASNEIDFWGKNRAALQAAEESAVASRYDAEVIGLSTAAWR